MNLTDLRAELDRQAATIDGAGDLPLEAVRRRASRIRNRRIAGTAAALAAAVVVAASIIPGNISGTLQPANSPSIGTDGLPSQSPPPERDDVVRDGFRIRKVIAGDDLWEGVIGVAGKTELSLPPFSLPNRRVALRYLCSAKPRPDTLFEVRVGAKRVAFSDGCTERSPDDFDDSAVVVDWPGGQGAEVTVRLTDSRTNRPVVDPSARLLIGVYEAGPVRSVGSVQVPEIIEHNGFSYRLDKLEHVPVKGSRGQHEIATPAEVPFILVYGTSGHDAVELLRDGLGKPPSTGPLAGPGWAVDPNPARPAGRAAIHAGDTFRADGEFLLGVYLPGR